jgi:hypothetical protein
MHTSGRSPSFFFPRARAPRHRSTVHHAWSAAGDARLPSLTGGLDTGERFVSLSGDGGFLFCAHELETAVRMGLNLTHIVWVDGSLNMVKVRARGRAAGGRALSKGCMCMRAGEGRWGARGRVAMPGWPCVARVQAGARRW